MRSPRSSPPAQSRMAVVAARLQGIVRAGVRAVRMAALVGFFQPPGPRRRRARPRRVLPLRLARQPVRLAPSSNAATPRSSSRRASSRRRLMPAVLAEPRIAPARSASLARTCRVAGLVHEPTELRDGHLVHAERKRRGERHFMRRPFFISSFSEPIWYEPAGTTTISGQSGQSRNARPHRAGRCSPRWTQESTRLRTQARHASRQPCREPNRQCLFPSVAPRVPSVSAKPRLFSASQR